MYKLNVHDILKNLFEAPDGTVICEFIIPGRPSTKKTSQRIVRVGKFMKIIPSERYIAYEKLCQPYVEAVWKNQGIPPIPFGVGIKLKIYLDSWVVGDSSGYFQACGDILEKFELIADDILIHWIDEGTHMLGNIDKENPRAEIKLVRFRHPKEATSLFKMEDTQDEMMPLKKKRKTGRKKRILKK